MRLPLLVIFAATTLCSSAVAAPVSLETDSFVCASLGRASGDSERLLLAVSLAQATSVWIVRNPKVRPDANKLRWCRDLISPDPGGEGCRQDGPPLAAGALDLEVAETFLGMRADRVQISAPEAARLAFVDDFRPGDLGEACQQGSRTELIDGKAYFSPAIVALDPRREFVLIIAQDDDGGRAAFAFGIVDDPKQVRRQLRKGLRERAKGE